MEVVTGLAQRIAVMHHGRLLAFDTPEAIMAQRDRAAGVSRRGAVVALLSVHDLHVYLGESHVLQGISFDVARGRRDRAARPERRRQDDDAARAARARRPPRARSSSPATTSEHVPTHKIVRRGVGLRPGGPRRLRGADGRREPPPRGARRRAAVRPRLRPLPRAARTRQAGGGHALGRAAADARDRPGAAERQPRPARRRADQGTRAAARHRGGAGARARLGADDRPARRAEPGRRAPRRARRRRPRHRPRRAHRPGERAARRQAE